eukprot:6173451-Pleurochrysis_carterae.AAC.3
MSAVAHAMRACASCAAQAVPRAFRRSSTRRRRQTSLRASATAAASAAAFAVAAAAVSMAAAAAAAFLLSVAAAAWWAMAAAAARACRRLTARRKAAQRSGSCSSRSMLSERANGKRAPRSSSSGRSSISNGRTTCQSRRSRAAPRLEHLFHSLKLGSLSVPSTVMRRKGCTCRPACSPLVRASALPQTESTPLLIVPYTHPCCTIVLLLPHVTQRSFLSTFHPFPATARRAAPHNAPFYRSVSVRSREIASRLGCVVLLPVRIFRFCRFTAADALHLASASPLPDSPSLPSVLSARAHRPASSLFSCRRSRFSKSSFRSCRAQTRSSLPSWPG